MTSTSLIGSRRAWLVGSPRAAVFGWVASACASLALFPVLQYKGFVFAGLVLSAFIVALGVALRAARIHWSLVTLGQLLALAEWTVVAYGHRQATAVFIPNAGVLRHIVSVIREGVQTANLYQTPIPNVPGLELMLIAAIAGVAIAVDLVATSWRHAPWAGIPLLAVYIIPVATLGIATNWPYFLIGALGYTTLLMADERERVVHWGRVVPRNERVTTRDAPVDTSAITWLGRRISMVAIVVAIATPWFVPDVSGKFFHGSGKGPGTASNGALLAFNNPLVSLAHSLQSTDRVALLTVHSKSVVPGYLRLTVVDSAGPDGWTPSDPTQRPYTTVGSSELPTIPGLDTDVRQRPYAMRFTPESALGGNYLPVPFNVRRINVSGFWIYDSEQQTVQAGQNGVGNEQIAPYNVNAATVEPTANKLRIAPAPPADIVAHYGRVPSDLPPTIREQARTITEGAKTDYDKALLIQSFLRDRSHFKYDTNVGYGSGYQGLVNFLRNGRGYCQQFAAAMAYLARAVGLPTRIAIGFLSSQNKVGRNYLFTTRDLHAWPEIYFSGAGWVRFEPTPDIADPPRYAGGRPTSTRQTGTIPSVSGHHTTTAAKKQLGGTAADQGGQGGPASLPSRWWLLVPGILLLVFGPALMRIGVRRARLARAQGEGTEAESAWRELRDRIRDLRLPWPDALTPRARRRELAPLIAGDVDGLAALDRLALSVERSRFARTPLSSAEPIDDLKTVASSINQRQARRSRVVAYLLPRSLWPDRRDRSEWAFWRRDDD